MPTSNRDCQKCRIRRIKCDRGLPTCHKCASRSLECPGYSRRIRFISNTPEGRQRKQAVNNSPLQVARNPHHKLTLTPAFAGPFPDSTGPRVLLGGQELLHHFANSIAAQLVWVDTIHNPWRRYICPLTTKSPCVLYAVLALAAANLHVRHRSNSPHKILALNLLEKYRQKTLDLLTRYLTSVRRHDGNTDSDIKMDVLSLREALATTLLLWHLEMHFPSNSLWRLHLRTAQALIYHSRRSSTLLLEHDGCDDFLVSEFYCATVWPRLTLNVVEIDDMVLDPRLGYGHGTNAFLGFVQLMQRIILSSRSGKENGMNNTELESQAIETREAVLAAQGSVTLPVETSADITHVVNAWFHAILLFGHRALNRLDGSGSDETVRMTRDRLFESLHSLSSPLAFAQNQPWPLFIAGTECVDDANRQMWVESRLLSLINCVCPLGRPQMLDFLRDWWARPDSLSVKTSSWIVFKQERAKDGKEFVIW